MRHTITYVLEPSEECGWGGTASWLNSAFPETTVTTGLDLESPFLILFLEVFLYEEEKKKKLLSVQWRLKVSIYMRKCAYMLHSLLERLVFFLSVFYFLIFFLFWPCHVACGILVPWPGIEPGPPAVEVWSPNHWTTREFPIFQLFNNIHFFLYNKKKVNIIYLKS